MRCFILSVIFLFVYGTSCHAQAESRPVVGVAEFTCDEESPYTRLVTEKVLEMLTNTHRFIVVDRTSRDKVEEELELQKSEAFLDSKNLAQQDASLGASMLVTGHIVKIPVYRILNGDGSIRGYKASVAFQLKVVDVSTGISNEAQGFQGKASKEMLSPESAVTAAMQSIKDDIYEYFRINFPLTAKIVKVLDKKTLVINAGKETGVKVGDKFMVQIIELLDGKPYPSDIGTITVKKQSGASFSECDATSKIISVINSAQQGVVIQCSLIIKK